MGKSAAVWVVEACQRDKPDDQYVYSVHADRASADKDAVDGANIYGQHEVFWVTRYVSVRDAVTSTEERK